MTADESRDEAIDLSSCKRFRPSALHRVITTSRSGVFLDEKRIMLVTSDAIGERCRRLALEDLLGVSIIRTRTGRLGNIFFTLVAFLTLLAGVISMSPGHSAGLIMAAIGAAILLFCTLFNASLGPTCRCYLRTAVQNAAVPSATRLKPARQLAAEVAAAVRVAQADVLSTLEARQAPAEGATAASTQLPGEDGDV